MRLKAKRDGNEAEIVAALVAVGATVSQLNDPALPDLLVGYKGWNILMEIKGKKRGKLTPAQKRWHETWRGQVEVVRSVEEVLAMIGFMEY